LRLANKLNYLGFIHLDSRKRSVLFDVVKNALETIRGIDLEEWVERVFGQSMLSNGVEAVEPKADTKTVNCSNFFGSNRGVTPSIWGDGCDRSKLISLMGTEISPPSGCSKMTFVSFPN
jgi:hypothetical protein